MVEEEAIVMLLENALPIIWAVGVVISFIIALNGLFKRSILRLRPHNSKDSVRVQRLCDEARGSIVLGMNKPVVAWADHYSRVIRLSGHAAPSLTVGGKYLSHSDDTLRREIAKHLRRQTLPMTWTMRLIQGMKAVYWFNPILTHQLNLAMDDRIRARDTFADTPPAFALAVHNRFAKVQAVIHRFAVWSHFDKVYVVIVNFPVLFAKTVRNVIVAIFSFFARIIKGIVNFLRAIPHKLASEIEAYTFHPEETRERWAQSRRRFRRKLLTPFAFIGRLIAKPFTPFFDSFARFFGAISMKAAQAAERIKSFF